MKNWISIWIALVFVGCSNSESNINFEAILKKADHTVVMFLAPDCPLCVTLSTPFSELANQYPDVQFLGVISGNHYEAMEINMFATEKSFKPRIFRDYDYAIASSLKASITPEFLLLDSAGNTIYQGMLDDRILSLGSYKQTWNEHYLKDALDAVISGKKPIVAKTEAIGCVLEY